ncbi:MAG: DUF3791 domain-containing protein [Bacteroidales bacterium]|nr:DUF3791 domain-containing protein [Bacteroidales bacterium]
MRYDIKDIIEYTIALVNEFAKKHSLTEDQAYRYIRNHKGLKFIENNYGIMHTLDFNEVVESLSLFCRKDGGSL